MIQPHGFANIDQLDAYNHPSIPLFRIAEATSAAPAKKNYTPPYEFALDFFVIVNFLRLPQILRLHH